MEERERALAKKIQTFEKVESEIKKREALYAKNKFVSSDDADGTFGFISDDSNEDFDIGTCNADTVK